MPTLWCHSFITTKFLDLASHCVGVLLEMADHREDPGAKVPEEARSAQPAAFKEHPDKYAPLSATQGVNWIFVTFVVVWQLFMMVVRAEWLPALRMCHT